MESIDEYKISVDMGGGGIKQTYCPKNEQAARDVQISEFSKVVLFTPDAGKVEKDEFFIPNLHNGLFRISTFLSDRGIENTFVCTDIDDMETVWEKIAGCQPAIIGFSTYYNTMQKDLLNIRKAIDYAPNSLIVVGGFEASLNQQWMRLSGIVDAIVMGEGEMPLFALINAIVRYQEAGGPFHKKMIKQFVVDEFNKNQTAGICVLDSDGIAYHKQMERITKDYYQEINLTAFHDRLHESPVQAYWQLTKKMFNGEKDCYFRFITSDHCPWKCKFCQSSVFYSALTGKQQTPVRYLEPKNIIKIIAAVSKTYPYITHIYIDDENFLIHKQRAMQTADLIIQAKRNNTVRSDIRFISRARTNNINSEICAKLKSAGWVMLSVGTESYSQEELDFMNKRNTVAANKLGVQTILAAGLKAAENYILFTPITTSSTFYETAIGICENIVQLSSDCAATHFLTPLPGTELWGDGRFEAVRENPYNAYLPQKKILFTNQTTGFDYLGEHILVPGNNMTFPHPETILPNDEFMRKISLLTLKHLPDSIHYLKTYTRNSKVTLSRRFVTLANLFSTVTLIFERTDEARWKELRRTIINGVKSLYA